MLTLLLLTLISTSCIRGHSLPSPLVHSIWAKNGSVSQEFNDTSSQSVAKLVMWTTWELTQLLNCSKEPPDIENASQTDGVFSFGLIDESNEFSFYDEFLLGNNSQSLHVYTQGNNFYVDELRDSSFPKSWYCNVRFSRLIPSSRPTLIPRYLPQLIPSFQLQFFAESRFPESLCDARFARRYYVLEEPPTSTSLSKPINGRTILLECWAYAAKFWNLDSLIPALGITFRNTTHWTSTSTGDYHHFMERNNSVGIFRNMRLSNYNEVSTTLPVWENFAHDWQFSDCCLNMCAWTRTGIVNIENRALFNGMVNISAQNLCDICFESRSSTTTSGTDYDCKKEAIRVSPSGSQPSDEFDIRVCWWPLEFITTTDFFYLSSNGDDIWTTRSDVIDDVKPRICLSDEHLHDKVDNYCCDDSVTRGKCYYPFELGKDCTLCDTEQFYNACENNYWLDEASDEYCDVEQMYRNIYRVEETNERCCADSITLGDEFVVLSCIKGLDRSGLLVEPMAGRCPNFEDVWITCDAINDRTECGLDATCGDGCSSSVYLFIESDKTMYCPTTLLLLEECPLRTAGASLDIRCPNCDESTYSSDDIIVSCVEYSSSRLDTCVKWWDGREELLLSLEPVYIERDSELDDGSDKVYYFEVDNDVRDILLWCNSCGSADVCLMTCADDGYNYDVVNKKCCEDSQQTHEYELLGGKCCLCSTDLGEECTPCDSEKIRSGCEKNQYYCWFDDTLCTKYNDILRLLIVPNGVGCPNSGDALREANNGCPGLSYPDPTFSCLHDCYSMEDLVCSGCDFGYLTFIASNETFYPTSALLPTVCLSRTDESSFFFEDGKKRCAIDDLYIDVDCSMSLDTCSKCDGDHFFTATDDLCLKSLNPERVTDGTVCIDRDYKRYERNDVGYCHEALLVDAEYRGLYRSYSPDLREYYCSLDDEEEQICSLWESNFWVDVTMNTKRCPDSITKLCDECEDLMSEENLSFCTKRDVISLLLDPRGICRHQDVYVLYNERTECDPDVVNEKSRDSLLGCTSRGDNDGLLFNLY